MTRVLVVGGGAAGFFGAIACAENAKGARIVICEATAHPLAKVRVSGGGRCNVTHACFDPAQLVKRYPRGGRELLGPFHRWQPRDTVAWFTARGVELKTEPDGRMFPVTDDSGTIVDCLRREAAAAGVELKTGVGVTGLEPVVHQTDSNRSKPSQSESSRVGSPRTESDRISATHGYRAHLTDGSTLTVDRVLVATGGNKSSAGLAIAKALGHAIEPPVPSLFTFHVKDPRIEGLAGVSVDAAEVSAPAFKLDAPGAVLVTHWGLSGPAVLRLSAWGARPFAGCGYSFEVRINFAPDSSPAEVVAALTAARTEHAKKQLVSWCPVAMPSRLWERLIAAAGIPPDRKWAALNNALLSDLGAQLSAAAFAVTGKSMNKEEFVTCGGVRLSEVNFKTMESRLAPGLFFAGEVLDIDGLTGGFNFQAAWTTARIAGEAMGA